MELLSPAKNVQVGMAAISHGADAVYIGAPRFGARSAVGNTIEEIEKLVSYAHLYGSKVYVALNTILKDDELEDAQQIIHQLYNAGVDAIIVQDMGVLMLDLPPISLHASTQCDIRTIEKVEFLEKCGFEQVVLARETTLETMKEIAAKTNVKLETFVHGALCVSYSGQCFMSQAYTGRSANRGECAQLCRLPYNLLDENGNILVKNKHLLSLKDFDASVKLREMVDAGIHSFKIEGRLKDEAYVKNITAYYRKRLDAILVDKGCRANDVTFGFEPDPKKTFYRGATTHFLEGRKGDIESFDTPKSMGEPVGRVKDTWRNALTITGSTEFANGDGLCFLDKNREFQGFRVNKVEGGRLFPLKMPNLEKGTPLYRNHNELFEKQLAGESAERLIEVDITLREKGENFELEAKDIDGNTVTIEGIFEKQEAQNVERTISNITTQLSKMGGTPFKTRKVDIDMQKMYFLPASVLNQWRREVVEKLTHFRIDNYKRSYVAINKTSTHIYPQKELDYRANVYNNKAKLFYEQHGSNVNEMAYELNPVDDAELMRCKHCIRYSIGQCPVNHKNQTLNPKTKLFLENSRGKYVLQFDCKNCEMVLRK